MFFDQSNLDPVSEEFNRVCTSNHLVLTVKPLPNPGDPYRSVLMYEFRSFSDRVIRVTQNNSKKTVHHIPAQGTVQMILTPDEPLPTIERLDDAIQ